MVIKVENLGKKYIITSSDQEKYYTLRDSIAKIFKKKSKSQSDKEDFWALRDLNFEIRQGEKVGIIGRNGAGKSTLLKLLSKITEPTTGRITIDGRVASLLEVGTGFHPELTGRENIFLNAAILGMSRSEIKKKFDEIVDFAEVEKFLDTPVKRFSSGMYVRLAFSVAAHLQPEILIVDEVLAVGDYQFQKKCLGKMDEVGKEGRTVLFVSHNLGIVKSLCDRAVMLEKGQIKYMGNVEDTICAYTNDCSIDNICAESFERSKKYPLWAKIVDVNLITEQGEYQTKIDGTKPFKVKLKIKSDRKTKGDMCVGFGIYDNTQLLCNFHSYLSKSYFKFENGVNEFQCEVEPTKLSAGNYFLKCWIYHKALHYIDFIDLAYKFDINDFDPYGCGWNYHQQQVKYYVNHKWSSY